MNNIVKISAGFLLGAGVGAVGSYFICKRKYINDLNEQLELIYKNTKSKDMDEKDETEEDSPEEKLPNSFEKPELSELLKRVKENHYDYTNPASILEEEDDDDESTPEDVTFYGEKTDAELVGPHPITKEEFKNSERPKLYYTAYGPYNIEDEDGIPLNKFEIEDLFGEEYDSYFHDWASIGRKLHIENDVTDHVYQILYADSYTPSE